MPIEMTVGARCSPLSRRQVLEVQAELDSKNIPIKLCPVYIDTYGDCDRVTSLRTLDRTNFFTREIDALQLRRGCRLSCHSAKDLPSPLSQGLVLAALTQGVDPSDSLVMRPGDSLRSLRSGAKVATSSERREETVRGLRSDLTFVDIRGNIGERLAKMERGEVDAVVIAEAALIRLGLTDLNRITLPGKTAALQGQLALICREEDLEARLMISPLDVRRSVRALYLGLDPTNYANSEGHLQIFHFPVIQVRPRLTGEDIERALTQLPAITHVLFTSKTAVNSFIALCGSTALEGKRLVAVGTVTASHLKQHGLTASVIAQEETAEGVVQMLEGEDLTHARCLWPHGNRSRSLIADYLASRRVSLCECIVYDTDLRCPPSPPNLEHFHQVVFTSPSTVDGFLTIYGALPHPKLIVTQGAVTRRYLEKQSSAFCLRS